MTDVQNLQPEVKTQDNLPNPTRAELTKEWLTELGKVTPSQTLIDAWVIVATLENSKAAWNPFDTTQAEDGATPYNSFGPGGRYHVWNYLSAEQGLSAFLKTIGAAEYAPLRRVMLDPTSDRATILAAIATSPWTGVTNDPHLYDGVEPDNDVVVDGPGGWPYGAKPVEAAEPEEEPEIEKVESATEAQTETVVSDEKDGKIAAAKVTMAKLKVHIAELEDLLNK